MSQRESPTTALKNRGEVYRCPYCKKIFDTGYVYPRDAFSSRYECGLECPHCDEPFRGVDSLERCGHCAKKSVDCLLQPIVVSLYKVSEIFC